MKTSRIVLVGLVSAVLLWGAYRGYRAHANLVSLSVRNMDVRRVVTKLEWQTWNKIVVNKNVGGNVTLNVQDVPLDEVLNIIGLQTDSRWTRLYPIYSSRKSIQNFDQVLLGNLPPDGNGWLALDQLAAWQQAGLGGFANTLRAQNKLVSAQFSDKDATFTALALSRFSKAQIVPEDNLTGVVNLTLKQVPFEKAVAKVARQLHRQWGQVYTLQPLNGNSFVKKVAPIAVTNTSDVVDTNLVAASVPAEPALAPERALEALTSTMTPEEKQQTLDQIAAANQPGSMSSSQAQQPGGGGGSAAAQAAAQEDMESRIDNRLKNGTVDQRLGHDRRVLASKQPGAKP